MKPFDIEAAMCGDDLQTECGMGARIVCYDFAGPGHKHPLLAVITSHAGVDFPMAFTRQGESERKPGHRDITLAMAPVKHSGWMNIYPCNTYETEEYANREAVQGRVDCIKVEWEE